MRDDEIAEVTYFVTKDIKSFVTREEAVKHMRVVRLIAVLEPFAFYDCHGIATTLISGDARMVGDLMVALEDLL